MRKTHSAESTAASTDNTSLVDRLSVSVDPAPASIILCQASAAARVQQLLSVDVRPAMFSEFEAANLVKTREITILVDANVACSPDFCRFAAVLTVASAVKVVAFQTPLLDDSTGRFEIEDAIRKTPVLPGKSDFSSVARAILTPNMASLAAQAEGRDQIIDLLAEVDAMIAPGLEKALAAALGSTAAAVKSKVAAARRQHHFERQADLIDVGGAMVRIRKGECFEVVSHGVYGEVAKTIAGFSAEISEQLTFFNAAGKPVSVKYLITGEGPVGPLHEIQVSPAELFELDWTRKSWGTEAPLPVRNTTTAEFLRVALEHEARKNATKTAVYTTVGWHTIDGEPVYLHSGGGISAAGDISVRMQLPDRLQAVNFPPAATSGRRKVVEAMLAIAKARIAAPILAAVFRAVLMLADDQVDSLYLLGSPGSGKSSILGTMMQWFGSKFASGHGNAKPPGSFEATANALRTLANAAGSMIFGVDDAAPQDNVKARDILIDKIETVGRSHANKSSRSRLTRDSTLQEDAPPRGLLVVTGEEFFVRTPSLKARFFRIEIGRDDVDFAALTAVQDFGNDGHLAAAMADFIRWLIEKGADGEAQRIEVPNVPRAGQMVGTLVWAANNIGKWLLDRGEFSDQEAKDFVAKVRSGIVDAARRSYCDDYVAPGEAFMQQLRTAISCGSATKSHDWGSTGTPSCPLVAYIDSANNVAYVICNQAFLVVSSLNRNGGEYQQPTNAVVVKNLIKEGFIINPSTSRGTAHLRRTINGQMVNVWMMPLWKFKGYDSEKTLPDVVQAAPEPVQGSLPLAS